MNKLTIEEMQSLAETKGGKCLSIEYVDSKTKLKWLCDNGHVFKAKPNNIKRGTWCPVCGFKRISLSKIKTPEQIKEAISEEYPPLPRLDPLRDRRRKLTLEQIEEMQVLHSSGIPVSGIAKKFGVCYYTAYCYVTPKARERKNRITYMCLKDRLARDPEFREKMRKAKMKHQKRRLKDPEYINYYKKIRNIWQRKKYYEEQGRLPG